VNASPQFHQLPMFMSAREIKSQYQPLDADRLSVNADGHAEAFGVKGPFSLMESDYQLYARKLRESGGDLERDIMANGVTNPILLEDGTDPNGGGWHGRMQIVGGHHRVAVMLRRAPDQLMPVEHHKNLRAAKKYRPDR